ncbi:hypothetical protein CEXT_34101 [Caerostris extrusa]|uniref:Uncharacterized protein n=1 Tax=Caerostris extrusa TaxID=172846 RepID=A0AAV4P2X3_CAEEX|nr:hypothetical protein CEXT_34101 [Caerostris extrusa]
MNSVPHHERNKWQCCLQRRKQGPFHAHLHTPSIHQRHNRSLFMGPLRRHERLPDHKHRMKTGTMKEKYPHTLDFGHTNPYAIIDIGHANFSSTVLSKLFEMEWSAAFCHYMDINPF